MRIFAISSFVRICCSCSPSMTSNIAFSWLLTWLKDASLATMTWKSLSYASIAVLPTHPCVKTPHKIIVSIFCSISFSSKLVRMKALCRVLTIICCPRREAPFSKSECLSVRLPQTRVSVARTWSSERYSLLQLCYRNPVFAFSVCTKAETHDALVLTQVLGDC